MFSFVIPCTITFAELQYGFYQSIDADIVKRVTNILYRNEFQHDPDVQDDRGEAYLGLNDDSNEEFEATYEAGDEDDDGDVGGEAVTEILVVPAAVSQPMGDPPFMRSLDLDAMHAPEFPEHDEEFRIGMEYGLRKSVIAAIQSHTISRGVDYIVYESEPQTFYVKCKNYGRGCDWLIQASFIQKKAC
ncbi:hypothetical protein Ahy_B02g061265 [Arachis hypogaea]|uniref:Transposase MuDR plant domain-containing protein n=1 Tax=Arachis hypogaea TaxID=3818 RepID=A0A445AKP5_ARAHY|nr:hypothetical protein Ahy_B02g061265 [Arachis hypogaea]